MDENEEILFLMNRKKISKRNMEEKYSPKQNRKENYKNKEEMMSK